MIDVPQRPSAHGTRDAYATVLVGGLIDRTIASQPIVLCWCRSGLRWPLRPRVSVRVTGRSASSTFEEDRRGQRRALPPRSHRCAGWLKHPGAVGFFLGAVKWTTALIGARWVNGKSRRASTAFEVETGIEPVCTALQAVASPLGHSTAGIDATCTLSG